MSREALVTAWRGEAAANGSHAFSGKRPKTVVWGEDERRSTGWLRMAGQRRNSWTAQAQMLDGGREERDNRGTGRKRLVHYAVERRHADPGTLVAAS